MQVVARRSEHRTISCLRSPVPVHPRESPDLLAALDSIAALTRYRRNQEICDAGKSISRWYQVAGGLARQCAYFSDGRRQILAFLFPGDFFGFAARTQHRVAVEAVSDGTIVARYSARGIEGLFATSPGLVEEFSEIALESLRGMQTRMLSLGRMTARERVCEFLIEMNGRSPGRCADSVALRMSRYDIADYLALSVETVSLALTDLRLAGAIAMPTTRQVQIADREALVDAV